MKSHAVANKHAPEIAPLFVLTNKTTGSAGLIENATGVGVVVLAVLAVLVVLVMLVVFATKDGIGQLLVRRRKTKTRCCCFVHGE